MNRNYLYKIEISAQTNDYVGVIGSVSAEMAINAAINHLTISERDTIQSIKAIKVDSWFAQASKEKPTTLIAWWSSKKEDL